MHPTLASFLADLALLFFFLFILSLLDAVLDERPSRSHHLIIATVLTLVIILWS